jgi:hypothetical protein
MNKLFIPLLIVLIYLYSGCSGKTENINYRGNPAPLKQNAYIKLPLGSIKPEGWLKAQLEAQAEGLTGNIDDFWPDLVNSSWRGGNGEAWEREAPTISMDLFLLLIFLMMRSLLKKYRTG